MNLKTPRPATKAAFSLVEVVIALGVTAFCLLAIFGLLSVALQNNQASGEQTAANGILSAVAADLRATPATTPLGSATTSQQFSIPIPANPTTSPVTTTLYFTSDGKSSALSAARYRLTIKFLPNGGVPKAATLINLKVSWPAPVDTTTRTPNGFVQTFVALDRN